MPVVVIRPTPLEFSSHRASYDDFVGALEAEGFEVRLDRPAAKRGPMHAAVEVAIYLFEHADNIVASALIAKYALNKIGKAGRASEDSKRRAAVPTKTMSWSPR